MLAAGRAARSSRWKRTTPVNTGTDGAFHFDKVLAGSYRIQVVFGTNNDAGWVAELVPVTVTPGRRRAACR